MYVSKAATNDLILFICNAKANKQTLTWQELLATDLCHMQLLHTCKAGSGFIWFQIFTSNEPNYNQIATVLINDLWGCYLMFYIINSIYSIRALPFLQIIGFQSEFPIILMHSQHFNESRNFAVWPWLYENTALIGIVNDIFSCVSGSNMHPHLWQIMLQNWLMCHSLHMVLNDVAHPSDLWITASPQSDPESLSSLYLKQRSTSILINPFNFNWSPVLLKY